MVLTQDSDPDSPVHIEAARKFSAGSPSGSAALPSFPYLIYRNPKFMRTMQNIETEWTQWANTTLIGKLPVNNKTREAAMAELQSRLKSRGTRASSSPAGRCLSISRRPRPSRTSSSLSPSALRSGARSSRSTSRFPSSKQRGGVRDGSSTDRERNRQRSPTAHVRHVRLRLAGQRDAERGRAGDGRPPRSRRSRCLLAGTTNTGQDSPARLAPGTIQYQKCDSAWRWR